MSARLGSVDRHGWILKLHGLQRPAPASWNGRAIVERTVTGWRSTRWGLGEVGVYCTPAGVAKRASGVEIKDRGGK